MANTDNLNYRGKFKQYDADGKPYLYKIGDTVDYKGKKYVAVKPTSSIVPGSANSDSTWLKLAAGGGGFYISDDEPTNTVDGDRWYRPTTSIMYTRISQGIDLIWVEL